MSELRWMQKQLACERLKTMSQTLGHKPSVTSLQVSYLVKESINSFLLLKLNEATFMQ